MLFLFASLLFLQTNSPVFENDFVQVFRNVSPCAAAGPACGERILVALGPIELGGKKMVRGDLRVFEKGQTYTPPSGGDYVEVVMRPVRPPVKTPPVRIAPEGNSILYDGARFFIFEEKLPVGGYRPRHSHSQRLVININATQLEQRVDGQDKPVIRDSIADDIHFNEPIVHDTKNLGKNPMRNIVIEMKP
jgi:hypothetical protein